MSPPALAGRRPVRWSRELVLEKIADWAQRYGDPPCSADWNPSIARRRAQEWRIARYRAGVWPSTNAVKRLFGGSFSAAVIAAGHTPHRSGPRPAHPAADRVPRAPVRAAAENGPELATRLRAAESALAEAERRARRAEERLEAARERARRHRERARRAEAARDRALADERRPGHVRHAAVGPDVLAGSLRALASARASGDRLATDRALASLASAAADWRDAL